jgi:glycosyltransferase involved in cell wall biosynthesis
MSAATPTVSVILPVYDRLRFLVPAVESVFAQTVSDWELIVADDGSAEPTRAWLASLRDPRVRVLLLAHSANPSRVRNSALGQARGRHVAFIDSDDLWATTHLERHLEAAHRHPDRRWSYSACGRIDAAGRHLHEQRRSERIPRDGWIFEQLLARRTVIAMPAVVATRELLAAVGGFDEELRFGEFHDLCLRLALRSPVTGIREPLCFVRAHDEHYSANRAAAFAGWMRLYEKHASRAQEANHRAICQRMRAVVALDLARLRRAASGRTAAVETLRSADVFSWRHVSLWGRAVFDLARPRR